MTKYIYKITNTINGKVYIGQTFDLAGRWAKHRYMVRQGSKRHLYSAIRKYGEDNFTMEVIEECLEERADEREVFWIMFYDATNSEYGYNETPGGIGCIDYLAEHRKTEFSEKLSKALKGKPVSLAARENLSKKLRNREISQGQREKISKTLKEGYATGRIKINLPPRYDMTGYKHSDESRAKMSAARNGKTYEEIYDFDTARQLKEASRKRWMGHGNPNYVDVSAEQIVDLIKDGYQNKEIAELLNISTTTIWERLKGVGLTATMIREDMRHNENNV